VSYFARHKTTLLYLAVGQVGWFVCVLSAARALPSIGVAFVVAAIVWHLARAPRATSELKLVASVTLIGAAWESALVIAGLLAYPNELPGLLHAPYWIVALWALFAIQLNVAYGWLKQRLALAALFGAIAGPASFRAGAALHALRIDNVWRTMPVLAIGWACLLPLAVLLSRRWNGIDRSATE
jgi:Protein of unknown function (DUF2878)